MEKAPIGGSKSLRSGINLERVGQEVASRTIASWTIGIRITRIEDLHRTDTVRHIGGRAAPDGQVIFGLVHLYRKTGR